MIPFFSAEHPIFPISPLFRQRRRYALRTKCERACFCLRLIRLWLTPRILAPGKMQINLLSRPTFSYLCEDVAARTRRAIAAGRRATRRRVRFAVRRRRSKLAEHERILTDLTGIQASGAQTPVDAPERGGQRRGVAHAHLGRAYLRSVTGFRPAALHPDSLAGGLHPRAGIPAGLRGQPLARNAAAKHHAARLDRAADDPDAYLQRQHRPHHGGQDARGTQRRRSRQYQGRQDAGRGEKR